MDHQKIQSLLILVRTTAPRLNVARAYAISKLSWIREQQRNLKNEDAKRPGNSPIARVTTSGAALSYDRSPPGRQTSRNVRPQTLHPNGANGQRCRRRAEAGAVRSGYGFCLWGFNVRFWGS